MLRMWDSAGFSVDAIARIIREGRLTFAFLDAPSITGPPRTEMTYEEYAARRSIDMVTISRLNEALGLEAPRPADRMREGEAEVLDLMQMVLASGASEAAVLRLPCVCRRPAASRPGRGGAVRSRDRVAGETGRGRRERPARSRRRGRSSAEELGDEVAAEMAGTLASMVETISRRHEGRPVRWLGDGGMFVFRDPESAVAAGLEVVGEAPRRGLPPTHVGIHSDPVIFQDGDIYGRTVNLAARLSALAGPSEVLVRGEVVATASDGIRFRHLGPVTLKGISAPVEVYRAGSV